MLFRMLIRTLKQEFEVIVESQFPFAYGTLRMLNLFIYIYINWLPLCLTSCLLRTVHCSKSYQ